jgi:phosphoribosylformylglycinamidine synthase
MAFAGGFGMNLDLSNVPRSNQTNADELILFSESNSRFIAEISPKNQKEFEHALIGVPFNVIGQVTEGKEFIINGMTTGEKIVDTTTDQLKASWQGTFNW